ncbi:hypothetical protein DPEC_G00318850, partial [Dallia pectoralis]
ACINRDALDSLLGREVCACVFTFLLSSYIQSSLFSSIQPLFYSSTLKGTLSVSLVLDVRVTFMDVGSPSNDHHHILLLQNTSS